MKVSGDMNRMPCCVIRQAQEDAKVMTLFRKENIGGPKVRIFVEGRL